MEIVILLAFIGLVLVFLMLVLFGQSLKNQDYQHADRLALMPIRDDDARPISPEEVPSTRRP